MRTNDPISRFPATEKELQIVFDPSPVALARSPSLSTCFSIPFSPLRARHRSLPDRKSFHPCLKTYNIKYMLGYDAPQYPPDPTFHKIPGVLGAVDANFPLAPSPPLSASYISSRPSKPIHVPSFFLSFTLLLHLPNTSATTCNSMKWNEYVITCLYLKCGLSMTVPNSSYVPNNELRRSSHPQSFRRRVLHAHLRLGSTIFWRWTNM